MKINQKIKRLRIARGLTLEKFAQLSDLSRGYLSKVERSSQPPPVSTLQAIAVALGVDIAEFFEAGPSHTSTSSNLDIVRKAEHKEEFVSEAGYLYRPLLKHFRNKYMSPFLMTIEKGETDAFSHDSEEFDYVIKGTIEFHYEGEIYVLHEGDSFYFDSRKTHRIVNKAEEPAMVLAVNYNYRRF